MTELVLIRHGQLPADCAGKLIGRSDVPLSEEGREQCRRLAPLFDSFEVEKVYASPLSRTMESARLVVRDTREIFPDSRLQEFDFGAFGNREFAEANRTWHLPAEEWYLLPPELPWPEGESALDLCGRIHSFLDFLAGQPEKRVALITHGGFLMHLLGELFQIPYSERRRVLPGRGSLTRLDASGRLQDFNRKG